VCGVLFSPQQWALLTDSIGFKLKVKPPIPQIAHKCAGEYHLCYAYTRLLPHGFGCEGIEILTGDATLKADAIDANLLPFWVYDPNKIHQAMCDRSVQVLVILCCLPGNKYESAQVFCPLLLALIKDSNLSDLYCRVELS